MIPDHNPPFQTIETVVGRLQQQRDERLNFEDLRRLFHEDVVVFETQFDQFPALEGGVRARHGDDLGFAHQQVARSVQSAAQQLKGPEFFQLAEDAADVAPAAVGDVHVFGVGSSFEDGQRSVVEEGGEREMGRDVFHGGRGVGRVSDAR